MTLTNNFRALFAYRGILLAKPVATFCTLFDVPFTAYIFTLFARVKRDIRCETFEATDSFHIMGAMKTV